MILQAKNLSKSFGSDTILKDVSFHIEENEKAAIIGINGAGKSTLFKIIAGAESADDGVITISRGVRCGFLAQVVDENFDGTIYEEVICARPDILEDEESLRDMERRMDTETGKALDDLIMEYHEKAREYEEKGGPSYRSEAVGILKGLGYTQDDFDRPLAELSGGQKTRVALGRLLLSKPDILLLDEPTNHLDIESVEWLEGYIRGYSGAVLIIAHDRYFLDRTVTKIVEIERGVATMFEGNYTEYSRKKEVLRVAQRNAYLKQQSQIEHEEKVIAKLRQFNREKSIKRADSRQKKLDKMEVLDKPVEENSRMKLTLEPRVESGKDVLTVEGLSKSYDGRRIFSDLSFDIRRGERVALIGENGAGKTTVLKILCKLESADAGDLRTGAKVKIGYYDQEHQRLTPENTLTDELPDAYPDLTVTNIRDTLAAFLFTGDDAFKRVKDLSGGERGRLSMAKLMLSGANFLVLDEPTNHLDMISEEILEEVLRDYTGTVFFVSHDRYFINRVATRIIRLDGNGLTVYHGDYDYYVEKRAQLEEAGVLKPGAKSNAAPSGTGPAGHPATPGASAAGAGTSGSSDSGDSAMDAKEARKAAKAREAEQRRHDKAVAEVEERIAVLEEEKGKLEERLNDPEIATVSAKLNEVVSELGRVTEELEGLYEKWEELEG
ncbi:MAG: ABC-F family ATP-binding cassette domain-containing protein [Eubacterium sp.]|nr:ABC-F family ATP-binding cassette domain-containing protein [Eubacterium sp.]